ncbi:MAG: aminotransferase class V-fold PLP-dependent enzyme [Gammaproteobacteria bacterium]|nr:aminotransferase class V-fold PLP-dependent enzyme [Gammaproteobacteria bacterium]
MNAGSGEMIYLDYAATTPVDPRVAEVMMTFLTPAGVFANPASTGHAAGREAAEAVAQARAEAAAALHTRPENLVFTSGATESDNLAIKGIARASRRGKHIVTDKTSHKAVIDACKALEKEGFEVSWLVPEAEGRITPEQLRTALREDTALVALLHANNETGVVNDIAELGAVCREAGVPFHVDAAQSAGKLPLNLDELPIDTLAASGHKFYGPKGIGILYVRPGFGPVEAQQHGGGHERGLRSGTLPTHQIVGLSRALALAVEDQLAEAERLVGLREQLWQGLATLGGVHRNAPAEHSLPGVLNVSFEGVDGESLQFALPALAVSAGSACNSASREPSFVLRALGRSDRLAGASLRFSLGRWTSEQDVERAVELVTEAVSKLRAVAGALLAQGD